MEQLRCRLARENDLDFISELSGRVFSKYGNYEEMVPAWAVHPGVIALVITEETNPLGFAVLELERKGGLEFSSGQLLAIAVVPEYHGRGIGKALLTDIENLALQCGVSEIHLCTAEDNIQARSFFQKAGYRLIGPERCYYPKGQTALVMSKVLG